MRKRTRSSPARASAVILLRHSPPKGRTSPFSILRLRAQRRPRSWRLSAGHRPRGLKLNVRNVNQGVAQWEEDHDQLELDCSPESPPVSSRRGGSRRRRRLACDPDALGFGRGRGDLLVPKQHYLIAFSNGDMNNSWRAAFVNSMEQWGKKFKSVGPGVDYVWTNSAGDSAKQLQDCQTLLAQKPSILILSPNQAQPLIP